MSNDFFDQEMDNDGYDDAPMTSRPTGANVLINGSYQTLEIGSNFLHACQTVALQAGFGKFKVWLNGTEVRPSSVRDMVVSDDMQVEIKPFDEAGC